MATQTEMLSVASGTIQSLISLAYDNAPDEEYADEFNERIASAEACLKKINDFINKENGNA